ncbi:hypothetical protein CYY_003668 [Polysphondylium violaceum]|uniref:DDHD domain-containing protein n=1 Tax=Polysphondylium violaceum TaxID=133409 RepID=A0A8J4UU38_9MYCE|nr:hypothetical protein CYY_003668 [Polysphondylium violaceum]
MANNSNISINNNDDCETIQNIDHFILIIHGIGKHEENWVAKINKINNLYHTVTKIIGYNKNIKFEGIEWHSALHSHTDRFIEKVTPPYITKVHEMINHTLLDILFFTSPIFSQTIYNEVGKQLNDAYNNFILKNPNFNGKVSILAHSLGSMICYDILCNQPISSNDNNNNSNNNNNNNSNNCNNTSTDSNNDGDDGAEKGNVYYWQKLNQEKQSNNNSNNSNSNNNEEQDIGDTIMGSLMPAIKFPKLDFEVYNLFGIGSPIGVMCTIRGHTALDVPKCVNFFNIYDQSDPVAYLIEPLIDDGFSQLPESVAPHLGSKKSFLKQQEKLEKQNNSTTTTTTISSSTSSTSLSSLSISTSPSSPSTASSGSILSKFANKLPTLRSLAGGSKSSSTTSPIQQSPNSLGITCVVEQTEMVALDGASTPKSLKHQNNASELNPEDNLPIIKLDSIDSTTSTYTSTTTTTTTTTSIPKSRSFDASGGESEEETPNTTNSSTATTNTNNNKFCSGHRFDYKLKPTGFSNISEYSSVPTAHKSYWESKDVLYFIISNSK